MQIIKNGYTVKMENMTIQVETPTGEYGIGFITGSGSFGSQSKVSYIQLKKADKNINLDEIIASYLLNK